MATVGVKGLERHSPVAGSIQPPWVPAAFVQGCATVGRRSHTGRGSALLPTAGGSRSDARLAYSQSQTPLFHTSLHFFALLVPSCVLNSCGPPVRRQWRWFFPVNVDSWDSATSFQGLLDLCGIVVCHGDQLIDGSWERATPLEHECRHEEWLGSNDSEDVGLISEYCKLDSSQSSVSKLPINCIKCPESQSAQMWKITNDGWTRSGTGCFIAVPIWQQWASKGHTLKILQHLSTYRQIDSRQTSCSPMAWTVDSHAIGVRLLSDDL